MSIRNDLNKADPNRTGDALRNPGLGDLLNKLITGLTPTEATITVTANVATLANQPSYLWQINATTATTTGVKKLLGPAPITGPQAVVPKTGEAVWDGGKKVLFATVDVVTAASFSYATAADVTCSILARDIGQTP